MIHRDTGKTAVVQIKSGDTPVDVEALHKTARKMEAKAYVFSPTRTYSEEKRKGVEYIESEDLKAFGYAHLDLLPERVRHWFERSGG